jgi:hypothetical protein
MAGVLASSPPGCSHHPALDNAPPVAHTGRMSATDYDPEHPWERQPWDTEIGWALFGDYLALAPPRRLRAIAAKSGYGDLYIRTLARETYWEARAACWDEHLADLRKRTIENAIEESALECARRQMKLARQMQKLAGLEIGKLFAMASRDGEAPGVITAREALRFADRGIILERLVMGETTDRTEVGPNLDGLSLDDLRQMRALQDKAGVR